MTQITFGAMHAHYLKKSLSDEVKIIALFKVGTKITENGSLAHYVEFDKTQ